MSQYDGEGTQPNTIYKKPRRALSGGERLRLGYLTQSDTDPTAPPDPDSFHGLDSRSAAGRRRKKAQDALDG